MKIIVYIWEMDRHQLVEFIHINSRFPLSSILAKLNIQG